VPDTRWVVAPDTASVVSADRVAMIRPDRSDQPPVILEDAGAAIWEALRAQPAPTTAAAVADELGIPVDAVDAFLKQLVDLGFVQVA